MRHRRMRQAALALAVAATAVAGCSDDGSDSASSTTTTTEVTRQAFAQAVVDRCLERSEVVDETEPEGSAFAPDATEEVRRANASWIRRFATEFGGLADDVEDLEAPPDDEPLVGEMTTALRSFAEQMGALAGKVETATVAEADAGQAYAQLAAADARAAELGIPGGLSACGRAPEEPADDATVVVVTATEYAFQLEPATVPAGPVAFELRNEGSEIHELVLVRSLQPQGVQQALGAEAVGADRSAFVEGVGETSAGPGLTTVLNVDELTPGEYGLLCFVPGPDGVPHASNGQVATFTVQ